jgi:hypothetical protein
LLEGQAIRLRPSSEIRTIAGSDEIRRISSRVEKQPGTRAMRDYRAESARLRLTTNFIGTEDSEMARSTGYIGERVWKHPAPRGGYIILKHAPLTACPDGFDLFFDDRKLAWYTSPFEAVLSVKRGAHDDALGFSGAEADLPLDISTWWLHPILDD